MDSVWDWISRQDDHCGVDKDGREWSSQVSDRTGLVEALHQDEEVAAGLSADLSALGRKFDDFVERVREWRDEQEERYAELGHDPDLGWTPCPEGADELDQLLEVETFLRGDEFKDLLCDSCIAFGAKRIETRSWKTSYRGPLAIHAGKRKVKSEWDLFESLDFFQAVFWDPTGQCHPIRESLPFGALVAVADLVDCVSTASLKQDPRLVKLRQQPGAPRLLFWQEEDLGNYQHGRYGWILENIRPFEEPIPYRGEQGLFEVPDELVLGGLS